MANLLDFYFEQLVTESDMDTLQGNLEAADLALMLDQGYTGIVSGFDVTEHLPVQDLTVDIAGPGKAYDQEGRRIHLPASTNLDVSTDSGGSSTAVVGGGNEKWVSVFVQFERVPSDLKFDGNGLPVNFRQDEGYSFVVVQGAEAALGTATRPGLLSDALLIADILLVFGTTQIFDADIESADVVTKPNSRFQFIFNLTATSPAQIRVGPLPDAMQAVLSELNNHIADLANAHDADAIDFDPANLPIPGTWSAVAAAAHVQDAIDGIVLDLTQAASVSGAELVGFETGNAAWADAANPAGAAVQGQLESIVGDLGGTGGSAKVGAPAVGDLSAGSVRSQLDELDTDWGKLARVNTWTADQILDDVQVRATNSVAATPAAGFDHDFPAGGFALTGFKARHAALNRSAAGFTIVDTFDMGTVVDSVMVLRIFGLTVNKGDVTERLGFSNMYIIHKDNAGVTSVTEFETNEDDTHTVPGDAEFNLVTTGSENSIVELRFTTANANNVDAFVWYQYLRPHGA